MNQTGQALLIILLATLVSLTIGLAITQRSLTDVATSTKIDQSTRAFSAAEAGIEKAIGTNTAFDSSAGASPVPFVTSTELGNQSSADVISSGLVPISSDLNKGLEYPEIDKTAFAQFWLAHPDTLEPFYSLPPDNRTNFDILFGNVNQDADSLPGVEVAVVTRTASGSYQAYRTYLDSSNRGNNNFTYSAASCNGAKTKLTYNLRSDQPSNSIFYCQYTVNIVPVGEIPILVRVRILYDTSNVPQKIAIAPIGNAVLPAQIVIYTSKGYSGQTQRKLHLFVQKNVTPFYFDFSIFSSGPICKNANAAC